MHSCEYVNPKTHAYVHLSCCELSVYVKEGAGIDPAQEHESHIVFASGETHNLVKRSLHAAAGLRNAIGSPTARLNC